MSKYNILYFFIIGIIYLKNKCKWVHSCTQFKSCLSLVLIFVCLIYSRYSNIVSEEDELNTFAVVEVDKGTGISRKSVKKNFKKHKNCSYNYQINHHRYLQGLTPTPVITFEVVRIILLALYERKILENNFPEFTGL